MRFLAIPVLCLMLCLGLWPAGSAAQVRSVEVRSPRAFGFFLGDIITSQVDIVVDKGFSVQPASLPRPGPVTYWLDLRDVKVEQTERGETTRIRLNLTYQSFYAALDARVMEIPGFTVTVASGASGGTTTAGANVPPWSINVSPLREVKPPAREDPSDYLRPDGGVVPLDTAWPLRGAAALGGLALLALALLARDRAWWPFRARPRRAFAGTLGRIRRLSRGSDQDAAYREALLALHRGLDETDGRRVLADDLPTFLDRHPAYRDLAPALARFFAASRLAFFGRETTAARGRWPFADLLGTAKTLAAVERAS